MPSLRPPINLDNLFDGEPVVTPQEDAFVVCRPLRYELSAIGAMVAFLQQKLVDEKMVRNWRILPSHATRFPSYSEAEVALQKALEHEMRDNLAEQVRSITRAEDPIVPLAQAAIDTIRESVTAPVQRGRITAQDYTRQLGGLQQAMNSGSPNQQTDGGSSQTRWVTGNVSHPYTYTATTATTPYVQMRVPIDVPTPSVGVTATEFDASVNRVTSQIEMYLGQLSTESRIAILDEVLTRFTTSSVPVPAGTRAAVQALRARYIEDRHYGLSEEATTTQPGVERDIADEVAATLDDSVSTETARNALMSALNEAESEEIVRELNAMDRRVQRGQDPNPTLEDLEVEAYANGTVLNSTPN